VQLRVSDGGSLNPHLIIDANQDTSDSGSEILAWEKQADESASIFKANTT